MTIPLAAAPPGPSPAQAALPGARRAGADRGGDFASLLGAVAERPDAPGQERLDRAAPQQRGARHSQERDHDDRAARHDAAGRRDEPGRDRAADRAADRAERAADCRDRAAERRDEVRRDEVRRDATARRRDDAVAHAERAGLRRGGAEQSPSGEDAAPSAEPSQPSRGEAEARVGTTGGECATAAPVPLPDADATVEPVSQEALPQAPAATVLPGAAGAAALLGSTSAGVTPAADQTGLGTGAGNGKLAGVPTPVLVGTDLTVGTPGATAQSAPLGAQAVGSTTVTEAGAGTGTIDVTFLDAAGPLPEATSPAVQATGSPGQTTRAATSAGLVDEVAAVDPGLPAPAVADTTVTPLPGSGAPGRVEPGLAPLGLAERTSVAEPASAADALLRTNIGATVADLARAAHRDGSGATRVVIRLDPPELGTVTVALTVRGGEVRVNLLASDVTAVVALDARRTDIDHALADSGLSLGSFDVQSDSRQGQEQQQRGQERASAAGRPWRPLGPEMDWERAAAVDRAARGVWL